MNLNTATQTLGNMEIGTDLTVKNTAFGRLLCTKTSDALWHIRASAGRRWDAYGMDLARTIGDRKYEVR